VVEKGENKMKKLLMLVVMIGLVVSGCAHKAWVRDDGTEATYSDYIKANSGCGHASGILSWKSGIPIYGTIYDYSNQEERLKRYDDCMKERGYVKKANSRRGPIHLAHESDFFTED